jgi:hypothetical protein
MLPTSSGLITVPLATKATRILSTRRKLASAIRQAASVTARSPLVLTPEPDECAPDQVDHVLYCMSFSSNIVSLVSYDPTNVLSALSLLGQVTTDAPSPGTTFSGATCVVCGIAYDPTDKAFIISTAKWIRTLSGYGHGNDAVDDHHRTDLREFWIQRQHEPNILAVLW